MLIRGSRRLAGHWASILSTRVCSFFSFMPDYLKKKKRKKEIKHRFSKDGYNSMAVENAACLNSGRSQFLGKGFSNFPMESASRNQNNMIHIFFTASNLKTLNVCRIILEKAYGLVQK